jgi:hypothetical protein
LWLIYGRSRIQGRRNVKVGIRVGRGQGDLASGLLFLKEPTFIVAFNFVMEQNARVKNNFHK